MLLHWICACLSEWSCDDFPPASVLWRAHHMVTSHLLFDFYLFIFSSPAQLTPPTRGTSPAVLHINEGRQMLGSLGWWYPPNMAGAMKAASKTSAEANCPPLASIFFFFPSLFFFFNDRNRSGDDNPALNPTHKLCLNGGGSRQRRALLCLRLFIHVFNSVDRWPVLTRCPVIYSGQAALNPTRNIMNSVNSAFFSPLMPLFFLLQSCIFLLRE